MAIVDSQPHKITFFGHQSQQIPIVINLIHFQRIFVPGSENYSRIDKAKSIFASGQITSSDQIFTLLTTSRLLNDKGFFDISSEISRWLHDKSADADKSVTNSAKRIADIIQEESRQVEQLIESLKNLIDADLNKAKTALIEINRQAESFTNKGTLQSLLLEYATRPGYELLSLFVAYSRLVDISDAHQYSPIANLFEQASVLKSIISGHGGSNEFLRQAAKSSNDIIRETARQIDDKLLGGLTLSPVRPRAFSLSMN